MFRFIATTSSDSLFGAVQVTVLLYFEIFVFIVIQVRLSLVNIERLDMTLQMLVVYWNMATVYWSDYRLSRLIYSLRTHDHITDVLNSLHWLRVSERIQHKQQAGFLTHKILHDGAPPYLGPLIRVADLPGRRSLHSAGSDHLVVPPVKLSTVGSRAFQVAAAKLWNSLLDSVTSADSLATFRNHYKHYLFQKSHSNVIL